MFNSEATIFCIAKLRLGSVFYNPYSYNSTLERSDDIYYKVYDTKSKKTKVITHSDLVKNIDIIFNINRDRNLKEELGYFCGNALYIDTYDSKEAVLQRFASTRRSDLGPYSTYTIKEKEMAKKYTIIEKGEDYVIGINNREKKKIFSLSDILSMSNGEIQDTFNMSYRTSANQLLDYEKEIRDYLKYLNSNGGYKFKNSTEDKKNLSRKVVGADYIVRNNGDIVVSKHDGYIDLHIKNHNYPNIVVKGDSLDTKYIRSLKIVTGPKRLCRIDELGMFIDKTDILLPNTLEKIDGKALSSANIQEIDLTRCKNLKTLGASAFAYSKLKGLKIPDTVTQIGQYVTSNCDRLEYFICPKNYEYFDPSWVFGCSSLKTIVLPDGEMDYWKDQNKTSFARCTNLEAFYTSEANIDIAQEMSDYIYGMRKMINKRHIMTGVSEEKVRVIVVKRKD